MNDQIDKSAKILRMNFHVPPPWTPADGPARPLDGRPEGRHHVFAHLVPHSGVNAPFSPTMPSFNSVSN
jgi:hypothetical protein